MLRRHTPLRYAVAVAASGLALLLTRLLAPTIAPDIFTLPLAAVALSAYLCGLGPGLVAALLTSVGSELFEPAEAPLRLHGITTAPVGFETLAEGDMFLRLGVFAAIALLISALRLKSSPRAATPVVPRDHFWAAAAHELRTPLTSLLGQAQLLRRRLLRDDDPDERNLHSVDVVVSQAGRLNNVVSTLIDIARLDQGQLVLERAPLDVGKLVAEAVDAAQAAHPEHRFEIKRPPAPLMIAGDAPRLTQALAALLDNAARFSLPGSEVVVAIHGTARRVFIAVHDRGIGVPEEARKQLFDCFYRAPNAEQQKLAGAGTGLYIARALIVLHGGEVAFEPREGGGSTVRLWLPTDHARQSSRSAVGPRAPRDHSGV